VARETPREPRQRAVALFLWCGNGRDRLEIIIVCQMVAKLLQRHSRGVLRRHAAHCEGGENGPSISLTIFGSCRAGSVAIRGAIVKCASRTHFAIAIEIIPSAVNAMRGDLFSREHK
jgi:hypothetical protein